MPWDRKQSLANAQEIVRKIVQGKVPENAREMIQEMVPEIAQEMVPEIASARAAAD